MPEVLAAVDVGTNSVHAVVARVGPDDRFEVVAREKEQVRLGAGPGDMKLLSPEAVDRGVAALGRVRALVEAYGAEVRAVATSAVREAENRDLFLGRARAEAGIEVEVISGVEEARLIYLGVLSALPVYEQSTFTCDIGGGSTELVIGRRGHIGAARSLKVGAVRLTDRFFPDGEVSRAAVDACRRHVRATLVPFERAVAALGFERAVGASGTVEQVVRLARRGDPAVRTWNGAVATVEEVGDVVAELSRAARKGQLAAVDGLDPHRADIVLAGALVLDGVLRTFGIPELTVSEAALREGVLIDALARLRGGSLHHVTDVGRASVAHLADGFDDDPAHSACVATLALQLFDALAPALDLGPDARDHLGAAARLANVGLAISHDGHHKHSYYLIRNSDRLLGFTDAEIERIALVARYHRKSTPKARHPAWARLGREEQRVVRALAALLRVAIGLDRTHRQRVAGITVTPGGEGVVVTAVPAGGQDVELEVHTAGERSGLLAEVLGAAVQVVAGAGPR